MNECSILVAIIILIAISLCLVVNRLRIRSEKTLRTLNLQLEQRLRDQTAEMLELYNHAPCGYHSLGADGVVMHINDTELKWLGYRRDEVEGRLHLSKLLMPEGINQFQQSFSQLVENGTALSLEGEMRCKDGSSFAIQMNTSVVRDEEGRFLRAKSTVTNVAFQKQANEKLRKLSRAVESNPSMILITDSTGRVEYANPAWEQATGYHLSEVIGQQSFTFKTRLHPQEFYDHLWDEVNAGRIWRGEFCSYRKSGLPFWESAAIAPVYDDAGVITHFVVVKEDITTQKRDAEELRQAKESADFANHAQERVSGKYVA